MHSTPTKQKEEEEEQEEEEVGCPFVVCCPFVVRTPPPIVDVYYRVTVLPYDTMI